MRPNTARQCLLLLSLLLAAGPLMAAKDTIAEDRAWIEAYLQRERAIPAGQRALPANAIQLNDAERWQGRQVRVQMLDGRSRRGVIEQVSPSELRLRVIVNGGRFVYAIDRRQIYFLLAE